MTAKVLMFQGTGSDVGKSTLVTRLCRAARQRGLRVAPFKPQNMSNNAAACDGGGEIGRAQALQARACGLDLSTDFNPVLLKPQSDMSAQVVVHGKVRTSTSAAEYMQNERALLMDSVIESFAVRRALRPSAHKSNRSPASLACWLSRWRLMLPTGQKRRCCIRLKLFDSGDLQTVVFISRADDNTWRYYSLAVVIDSALPAPEKSLVNRQAALYRYLTGQRPDKDPPLAP